jgi:pilus assembly protein Flp/PilA
LISSARRRLAEENGGWSEVLITGDRKVLRKSQSSRPSSRLNASCTVPALGTARSEQWLSGSGVRMFEVRISDKFSEVFLLNFRLGIVDLRVLHHNPMEAELKSTFLNFLSDESGATAIEYGLIAAGISLAIIAIVNGLGTNLNEKFTSINTSLK